MHALRTHKTKVPVTTVSCVSFCFYLSSVQPCVYVQALSKSGVRRKVSPSSQEAGCWLVLSLLTCSIVWIYFNIPIFCQNVRYQHNNIIILGVFSLISNFTILPGSVFHTINILADEHVWNPFIDCVIKFKSIVKNDMHCKTFFKNYQ